VIFQPRKHTAQPKEKAKRKGRKVPAKNAKQFLRARCESFARLAVNVFFKTRLQNIVQKTILLNCSTEEHGKNLFSFLWVSVCFCGRKSCGC